MKFRGFTPPLAKHAPIIDCVFGEGSFNPKAFRPKVIYKRDGTSDVKLTPGHHQGGAMENNFYKTRAMQQENKKMNR